METTYYRRCDILKSGMLFVSTILLLCSCSTVMQKQGEQESWFNAVDELIETEDVADARYVDVDGKEFLEFDEKLKWRLEEYGDLEGLEEKRAFILSLLQDARLCDATHMSMALDHIPADTLEAFYSKQTHEQLTDMSSLLSLQEKIAKAYNREADQLLSEEIEHITHLGRERDLDRYFRKVKHTIRPSILSKGRVARILAALPIYPFVQAWIGYHIVTDDRSAQAVDFAEQDVYYPATEGADKRKPDAGDTQGLLAYYAPVVVIEHTRHPSYARSVDSFGEVYMTGEAPADMLPAVHAERPALYVYTVETELQGIPVLQLVYTLWFPEHPHIFGDKDPEAGILEGWTCRITLNAYQQPIVYESVSNCGCYYKIFPEARLEQWAQAELKTPLRGKRWCLENSVPGKIDATVPELVEHNEGNHRIMLFYEAGTHQLVTIKEYDGLPVLPDHATPYRLASYDDLENLPVAGYTVNLFGSDGVVRNACRRECKLLSPTGIYHPGHPRQRGTQLVYFDQKAFDSPDLLETYLRLPARVAKRKW